MGKTKQYSTSLNANEDYWSLGCILGFLGIPGMIIGNQLAKTYGVAFAILSIIIGNFVLWIFGLGIITMTEGKSHAIENIRKQLGKTSSLLAILLFTLAFLMWYTFQLSSTVTRTCQVFQIHGEWKIGLVLGTIIAILSSGGFKVVKWACVVGLPLLAGIALYYIVSRKGPTHYTGTSPYSFIAVLPVIMAWLAGTVNFPTFFRHSRSKANTIIALALILLFHIFFQISTVFYGVEILSMSISEARQSHMVLDLVLATAFSLVSFSCMNLINVYFISACWEMVFPRDHGAKKYVICAIIGTLTYVYLEVTNKIEGILLAEDAITYSMAILVVALLINFLISLTVRHRIRYLNRFLASMAWLIGCVVTIRALLQAPEDANQAFLSGIGATMLFAALTIFIEETIWSVQGVIARSRS